MLAFEPHKSFVQLAAVVPGFDSLGGSCGFGVIFDFLFLVLALLRLVLGDVHGNALNDLALGSIDHWVIHAHGLAIDVDEKRRGWVEDTWHKRRLDQLEVEFLGRIVAKDGTLMAEVQLEEVRDAEGLSVDALRGQSADVVVVTSVLAEEARTRGALALACDLELQDHLLLLAGTTQKEVLLRVTDRFRVFPPALIELDLRLVGDLQAASVTALRVVDVDHQVSRLAS